MITFIPTNIWKIDSDWLLVVSWTTYTFISIFLLPSDILYILDLYRAPLPHLLSFLIHPHKAAPSSTAVPSQSVGRPVHTFSQKSKLSVLANALTSSWAVRAWSSGGLVLINQRKTSVSLLQLYPWQRLEGQELAGSWATGQNGDPMAHGASPRKVSAPRPAAFISPAWTSDCSWDKAHERFLAFLKCVANQEWLLMCRGFSCGGERGRKWETGVQLWGIEHIVLKIFQSFSIFI